jgi:hypothetical protein
MSIGVQIFACEITTEFATDHLWREVDLTHTHTHTTSELVINCAGCLEWQAGIPFRPANR